MGKISINELAAVLIERKNLKRKSASAFVNELFYVIQKGLGQDRTVKVKGLGTFKIIDVDDRESVNVNNGERVLIEGHSKITFTPDSLMKELVNKPFSQFETVVLNEGVDFEPELEQEPEPESEPEPVLQSEVSDDVDASMAPLVEFVTDNELQISPESEPEVEPELGVMPEPVEDEIPKEDEFPIAEVETPFVETEASDAPIEASITEKETPIVEKEIPTVEESETPSEELELDSEEDSSGRWKMWLLGILACCLCFVGGFYVGNTYRGVSPMAEPNVEAAKPKVEVPKPDQAKPEQVKSDTPEPDDKPEMKPEVKPVAQPEPAVELDQYEKMDSRIRTGAYRIIGTDHVEKVKASDNLSKICKRTIGPGMECYLEVYNGIKGDTGLKVGQEIKIPKLERKKKKVKKDN